MRLDNAQLTAFAEVLRLGSFEAAARQLNVTPSAISQRIRLLEERLGQVLVNRKNPAQPTKSGATLARLAIQMDLLETEALRELGAGATDDGPSLRMTIAVNSDSLSSWFYYALDVLPVAEKITFDIRVEDQDQSAVLLRDGSVIAAVTTEPQPVQGCRVETLGVMRYLAVASAAFIDRYFSDGVNASSLAKAPLLVFNDKDALQQRFMQQIAPQTQPLRQHSIPSSICFIEMAKRELGWGMSPEILVKDKIVSGELCEIIPGMQLDVPLYWQHWRIKSKVLSALTTAVSQAAVDHLWPLSN